MRIRSAAVAFLMVVAMGLPSAALAGRGGDSDGKVKIKKTEKIHVERDSDRGSSQRWDRGDWTRERDRDSGVTVREYDTRTVVTERRMAGTRGDTGSGIASRQPSGPYRYFFTDQEGKYNYYLDRYSYPYRYGAGETDLPVGVLGYVPPEQIGGGPVRYFRPERPLSRSVFDGTGRLVD